MTNTVIIIPARNEARNLSIVLWELREIYRGEIVVVDDASTDGTAQVARDNGVSVIPLTLRLGAWGAIQAGFRYALKRKYTTAITMDADGQHVGEYVTELADWVRHGRTDMVVGSDPSRITGSRRVAWRLFRTLSGIHMTDLTSGFRAYSARAMTILIRQDASLLDYQDIGVLLLLSRNRCTFTEIDVQMRKRIHGKSQIFGNPFQIISYMLHTVLLCISHSQHIGQPKKQSASARS